MDTEYSHNLDWSNFGSCGLWGQVHVGVGPGESLSCPHSAHGRSRDLPRGTGGPPGEVGVDCGLLSVVGKDTDSEGLRKILLLVLFFLSFSFLFHFVLLLFSVF